MSVSDLLGNVATALIHVAAGVSVSPPSATAIPGQQIALHAEGGTWHGFEWSLVTNASGGAIDPQSVLTLAALARSRRRPAARAGRAGPSAA